MLALRRGGSVRSLFPLVHRGGSLDFIGSDICDFQDLVAGHESEACEGIDALLGRLKERGEELALSKISERGWIQSLLPRLAEAPAFVVDRCLVGPCPWRPISGSDPESVTAAFGKSTRKGTRRRLRELAGKLRARLEVVEGHEADFLAEAARLHLAQWDERGGNSLFRRDGFDGFLREIGSSAEVGLLGFALKTPDGRLVGFELGFERLGRHHSWMGAYDAAFAEFSPGICLQILAMAELGRRGVRAYDFLCGGELYKFHFASEEYAVHSLSLKPRSLLAATSVGLRPVERRMRPGLKRCLQRLGLYRTGYRIDELA